MFVVNLSWVRGADCNQSSGVLRVLHFQSHKVTVGMDESRSLFPWSSHPHGSGWSPVTRSVCNMARSDKRAKRYTCMKPCWWCTQAPLTCNISKRATDFYGFTTNIVAHHTQRMQPACQHNVLLRLRGYDWTTQWSRGPFNCSRTSYFWRGVCSWPNIISLRYK